MKTIVRTLFGSHLYGTSTPASDTDYKSVHLPDPNDILLTTARDVISTKTKVGTTTKNTADDIDDESFALHRFFNQLEKGESMALEVLFAPAGGLLVSTREWEHIQKNRERFLTKNATGMIGYCIRQCSKYGVKGGRVATSRAALELLRNMMETWGAAQKVGFIGDDIRDFVEDNPHTAIIKIPQVNGSTIDHWEVCDRKLPFTTSLKEAHGIVEKLFLNFGERARQAEANEGIDWKAVSHAIRVGYQGLELFNSGHITFPRPEASYLLDIKRGRLAYSEVEKELEWLLDGIELAAERSHLPAQVDRALMNDIVIGAYRRNLLGVPLNDNQFEAYEAA